MGRALAPPSKVLLSAWSVEPDWIRRPLGPAGRAKANAAGCEGRLATSRRGAPGSWATTSARARLFSVGTAVSGSSAATESQRVGRHWSDPDLLYPPRLARGRHSPARTHGGVRPAPAALRGAAAVGPQVLGYEFAWKL